MKFPSVITSALLAGAVVFLQYILGHLNAFGLNELVAPIAVVVLNTIIKMVQEWQTPEPTLTGQTAAARGEGEAQSSYLARVLYK